MNEIDHASLNIKLESALNSADSSIHAAVQLANLIEMGFDQIALPGGGATLHRWRALALVAQKSLSLAKLYEGHTDALAILAELGGRDPLRAGLGVSLWGTWAAESRNERVVITPAEGSSVVINGTKSWCSGAQTATHGLLTAWDVDARQPQLVWVEMEQPGIKTDAAKWQAVGMMQSASVDVHFSGVVAHRVGAAGEYLSRSGFWQGGAGIAACWYGGAVGLGLAVRAALQPLAHTDRGDFRLAALGKIDLALSSTAAVLTSTAKWIDENPRANAHMQSLRARLAAEACAKTVLDEAGRALGAAAFCRNAAFARAAADLPVFVRQSHAERDYAALANSVLGIQDAAWRL